MLVQSVFITVRYTVQEFKSIHISYVTITAVPKFFKQTKILMIFDSILKNQRLTSYVCTHLYSQHLGGRQTQEDCEFESSLGCLASPYFKTKNLLKTVHKLQYMTTQGKLPQGKSCKEVISANQGMMAAM